jgi:hypothetical protein
MMIVKCKEQIAAFLNGRNAGLRAANDAVDQLIDQLTKARAELRDARAWHDNEIEQLKSYFDAELAALRRELSMSFDELARAQSELARYQIDDAFAHWMPSETDRMQ